MWGYVGDEHMGMGWWLAGPLIMTLFWGAVIWLGFVLIRGSGRSGTSVSDTPREIARHRLASGEINAEEFDQIIVKLENSRPRSV
ncbi:MAG: hypothetical protein HQ478_07540 [Chloroflexi bacterium]|nr:hypothetical protein [Chloroflexota bacterium]